MSSAEVAPQLAAALRAGAALESAAVNARQRHVAIAANARLMLAAVNSGWTVVAIARAAGLNRHAASKRIQTARRALGAEPITGLTIAQAPRTPERAPSPLAILHTPVHSRAWLSAPEAMAHAGISFGSLTAWRKHGLLPNTTWIHRSQALYARSDLDRVLASARSGRGIEYGKVLELINASAAQQHPVA